jgi:hypothetical protein
MMSPEQFAQLQIEKYRQMTGEERLLIGLRLHELSCEVAREGIRSRHPNATPEFIEESLRKRLQLAYSASKQREQGND